MPKARFVGDIATGYRVPLGCFPSLTWLAPFPILLTGREPTIMSSCPSISLIGVNRNLLHPARAPIFLTAILSITTRSRDANAIGSSWEMDRGEGWSYQLSFELSDPCDTVCRFLARPTLHFGDNTRCLAEDNFLKSTDWKSTSLYRISNRNGATG